MTTHRIIFAVVCTALVASVYNLQPQWPVWSSLTFYYGATTTDFSALQDQRILSQKLIPARLASDREDFDTLLFVGDVMLARNVEVLMNRYGYEYPYRGVNFSQYSAKPAVIANFESSVPATHVFTPVNTLRFSVSSKYLSTLRQAGFTHLSLANNHTLDYGTSGFEQTVNALEGADFAVFGHPTTLSNNSFTVIDVSGVKVAIIGLHILYGEPSARELSKLFSTAKSLSELQIVYIHWGEEYETTHNVTQRNLAQKLVNEGADLIIGHHPHVVQGIEEIQGVPVVYSLGNYIFDQYFSDEVQTGLMLLVEILPEPKIHLLPVESTTNWSQPSPMNSESHQWFLNQIAERSDTYLKSDIRRGIVPWYSQVATSTEIAIMK